jgi:PhnB protein
MRWNPHLAFNGQCEAAFQFYAACLGGQIITMLRYGDTPMAAETPADWRAKILHATLALDDQVLTGADAPPEHYRKPQGFSVLLHVDGAAEAERVFAALAEKGSVQLPIQETFWALRFGMLADRFGIPWMINCGSTA